MAWGLKEPDGFGKYFPMGDYDADWDKKLEKLYLKITPPEEVEEAKKQGEKAYHYAYRAQLGGKIARKFRSDEGPLAPDEWPDTYRLEKSYKDLADMILMTSRLLAVTAPLKALIEELEPGVHQFWPMRITMPRNRDYPAPYYGFVIRTFLDSFLPEKSEYGDKSTLVPSLYFGADYAKDFKKLVFSKAVIGGHHIWREKHLRYPDILISDTLHEQAKKRGLKLFPHYRVTEV